MYYRIFLNVFVIVLLMFCGFYSDKYGRKFIILFLCFGSILVVIFYGISNLVLVYRIFLIIGGVVM